MKKTKRILSLLLVIVSLLSMTVVGASAAEADALELSDNAHLLSVRVVPNYIADAELPEDLANALTSDGATTYGTDVPSSSKVWNFADDGAYSFTIETTNTTVYSNYVFTGHNGKLKFNMVENSGGTGYARFQVRKRGVVNTIIYDVGVDRGTERLTIWSWDTGLESSDKVYFLLIPGGLYTNIMYGTFSTY